MRRNAARLFDRDNGITILPFHIQPFHETDFDLSLDDVIIGGTKLGEGAYGVVYSACHGEDVVAAKFQKLPEDPVAQKNLIAELSILKNISHPNLVKFIGAAKVVPPFTESMPFKGTGVLVIMERMVLGDLHGVLAKYYHDPSFSWKLRVRMAKQMAAGLACLHSHAIIHRDIKTKNVLLDAYWTAKLCDYGLAISAEANERYQYVAGTKEFMAPELQLGEDYSVQADIFSLGMVYAQLITNKVPGENGFLERHPRDLFAVDEQELRSNFPAECPESFATLCVMCCSHEPDNRPTAQEIVDWLDDLYNELPGECVVPDVDYLKLFNTPAGRLAAKAARRLRDLAKRKTFGGDDFHHDYRIVREYKRSLRNDRIRKLQQQQAQTRAVTVVEEEQRIEDELDTGLRSWAATEGQTSGESNYTSSSKGYDSGDISTPTKQHSSPLLAASNGKHTPGSIRRNAGTRSSMPITPLQMAVAELQKVEIANDFDSVGRLAAHERRHSTGDTRFSINFDGIVCAETSRRESTILGSPLKKLSMVKTFSGMYDQTPPSTAALKEPIYADSPRARRLLSEDNPALLADLVDAGNEQKQKQQQQQEQQEQQEGQSDRRGSERRDSSKTSSSRPSSNDSRKTPSRSGSNSSMASRLFGAATPSSSPSPNNVTTQTPGTSESRRTLTVSDSEPALRLLSADMVAAMSTGEVEDWSQYLMQQGQVLLQNAVRLLEHSKAQTRSDDDEEHSPTGRKYAEMVMMLRQARSVLESSISCLQCSAENNTDSATALHSPGSDYVLRGEYFSDTASTISSTSESASETTRGGRGRKHRKTPDGASYAKATKASEFRQTSPPAVPPMESPKGAPVPRVLTPSNSRHSLKKQRETGKGTPASSSPRGKRSSRRK